MKINADDLDLYPVLTGKQILELFFKEASQYLNGNNVPEKHTQIVKVAEKFIDWVTSEWEAGAWFLKQVPSQSGRGTNWFKKCKFDRDAFFSWIKTKEIISKLQKRGVKFDQKLIKAIEHSQRNSKTREKLPPAPTTDKAKKDRLRESYITAVVKILKNNPRLTGLAVLGYSSLKTLVRDSGLPKDKYPKDSHILKHWMPEARKLAGVPSKHGPKAK